MKVYFPCHIINEKHQSGRVDNESILCQWCFKIYDFWIDLWHHICSNKKCFICGHLESHHHGHQEQKHQDGKSYWRSCYGIGCQCSRRIL